MQQLPQFYWHQIGFSGWERSQQGTKSTWFIQHKNKSFRTNPKILLFLVTQGYHYTIVPSVESRK